MSDSRSRQPAQYSDNPPAGQKPFIGDTTSTVADAFRTPKESPTAYRVPSDEEGKAQGQEGKVAETQGHSQQKPVTRYGSKPYPATFRKDVKGEQPSKPATRLGSAPYPAHATGEIGTTNAGVNTHAEIKQRNAKEGDEALRETERRAGRRRRTSSSSSSSSSPGQEVPAFAEHRSPQATATSANDYTVPHHTFAAADSSMHSFETVFDITKKELVLTGKAHRQG